MKQNYTFTVVFSDFFFLLVMRVVFDSGRNLLRTLSVREENPSSLNSGKRRAANMYTVRIGHRNVIVVLLCDILWNACTIEFYAVSRFYFSFKKILGRLPLDMPLHIGIHSFPSAAKRTQAKIPFKEWKYCQYNSIRLFCSRNRYGIQRSNDIYLQSIWFWQKHFWNDMKINALWPLAYTWITNHLFNNSFIANLNMLRFFVRSHSLARFLWTTFFFSSFQLKSQYFVWLFRAFFFSSDWVSLLSTLNVCVIDTRFNIAEYFMKIL